MNQLKKKTTIGNGCNTKTYCTRIALQRIKEKLRAQRTKEKKASRTQAIRMQENGGA